MVSNTSQHSPDSVKLEGSGSLYKAVLAMVLAYIVLMTVFDRFGAKLAAPMVILVLGAGTLFLHGRGREKQAMSLFVWGIWAAATMQGAMRNGVANASLFAYPALMLLGGWVLGVRQGILLGLASIGASFLMALAEHKGLIVRTSDMTPFTSWFPMGIVMGSTVVAMHFILKVHWKNVNTMMQLNAELQRSERRFHVLADANPLPMAVSRLDNAKYVAVNPAWQREIGWSEEETVGRTGLELGFWEDPQQRVEWIKEIQLQGRSLNREIMAVTRDGRRLRLLMSAEQIDYDGHPCVLGIFTDQTERLRNEAQIKALNEKLESRVAQRTAELSTALVNLKKAQDELVHSAKLASLSQLVAGVAHELNTPIGNALVTTTTLANVTRSFDETLKEGNVKRSILENFVKQSLEGTQLVERSLHRASDLVRSFKQVAVDQASERRREFDLAEMVTEVVDTLRPNLKGSPWKIRVNLEAGTRLESFPGPLGQVVINLVMNAVLHAFEGRETGTITLHSRKNADDLVELVCTDNGCGIESDDLHRIFDPFFTTKLGQGGSGLGLAIVHRLVTQVLGGQIRVDSSALKGTEFTLLLPHVAPRPDLMQ